jgi:hypothetical protein
MHHHHKYLDQLEEKAIEIMEQPLDAGTATVLYMYCDLHAKAYAMLCAREARTQHDDTHNPKRMHNPANPLNI